MTLSPELEALRASVADVLADHCDDAALRTAIASETGYDARLYELLAQVGVLELELPELAIALEELGKALYSGPVLSSALAARALDRAEAGRELVAKINAGSLLGALAIAQPRGARIPDPTVGLSDGKLSGTAPFVIDGLSADLILVEAMNGGELELWLVEPGASGVTRTALPTTDIARRVGSITFEATPATRLGNRTLVERQRAAVLIAIACEQVGGAQGATDSAVSYSLVRTQFGRQIGSFQSIKHLCADMFVAVESGRAAVRRAAQGLARHDPDMFNLAHVAKAWASDAYVMCAENNVQIHGGIGFTWEHSAHLHLRRAKSSELLFGDAAFHRSALADSLGI